MIRGDRPGTGARGDSGIADGEGGLTSQTPLTRGAFLRRVGAVAAPAAFGASLFGPPRGFAAPAAQSLFVTSAELAEVRRNIFKLNLGFATRAWANTLENANAYLGYRPSPTQPASDLSDWRASIYLPGLHDGNAALTLAIAYRVAGRRAHGVHAKSICLAWARTYAPAPELSRTGHMVAEPVGPVIKLCMAYDLAKKAFSPAERSEFRHWAAQFVDRGRRSVDSARDHPWVEDVVYGSDRTNPAPYGNSATWQRAMAVWAAAVVGQPTLDETLGWNFRHTTRGGLDYGWDNLLEGLVIDGSGGQVTEDRYRSSIEYGHFSWIPAVLIADVARRAGFPVDLFSYRTQQHGYTVFTPASYYARFLLRPSIPDALEKTQYGGASWPATAARWRAAYEILYRNARDHATTKLLHRTVNFGGSKQRGDNSDVYILGYAALFGRGPHGPL